MADILTTSGDLDAIRELLGVDSTQVSDAVIAMPPYLPSAELSVQEAVPDWAARLAVPADALRLKTAAMCLTAVALIGRLRNRLRARESIGGIGGFTSGEMNWDALAADLEARAGLALAALTPALVDAEAEPVLFTVGGVSRASGAATGARWVGYR